MHVLNSILFALLMSAILLTCVFVANKIVDAICELAGAPRHDNEEDSDVH